MKKVYAFDLGIYNPYKMRNVKISVNKAIKEGKPFFGEDYFNEEDHRPWEVRYDNSYPTVFYDSYLEKYRCYYSTFTTDNGSSQYNLEERKKVIEEEINSNISELDSSRMTKSEISQKFSFLKTCLKTNFRCISKYLRLQIRTKIPKFRNNQ